MVKKFFLVAALVLMAGSVKADDAITSSDLKGISDVDNAVVEASVNIDVDAIANKTDKSEQAVEACFHGWGGGYGCYGGYNYGCYNYGYNYGCYNYYPCYSYSYYPCYSFYRPVCYTYAYPLYTWGCY